MSMYDHVECQSCGEWYSEYFDNCESCRLAVAEWEADSARDMEFFQSLEESQR